MPTSIRRGMRHARRGAFYLVTGILILLAFAVALANLALPMVASHPDRIANWLSQRAGRPVAFDHAEAHWTPRGPLFTLHGLRIGEGRQLLQVDDAQLLVAMYSGWLPDHPLTELRLHGLDLTLERRPDGSWHFLGLAGPHQQADQDPLSSLQGLGELQVSDARLAVHAPGIGVDFVAKRVDVRLRVSEEHLNAGLEVFAEKGAPLHAIADIDRESMNGRLWIGGSGLQLASWSSLIANSGVAIERGSGQVGVWIDVHAQRVAAVRAEAQLRDVRLRSLAPLPAAATVAMPKPSSVPMGTLHTTSDRSVATASAHAVRDHSVVTLDEVHAGVRWRTIAGGWQLSTPLLRLTSNAQTDQLDGLILQVASRVHVSLQHARVDTVASLAALSPALPVGLRQWLMDAAPHAQIDALAVDGVRDGAVHGTAKVRAAGFSPVAGSPALDGIAGYLQFDRDGLMLDMDSPAARLDWPTEMEASIPLQLHGRLTAWRDDAGWTLGASNLHVYNDEIELRTALSLRFAGDGSKPRLDMAANIGRVELRNARHYWLRHHMSAESVEWLDAALGKGNLLGAQVLVGGDLDDWPFLQHQGLFEGIALVDDATVKFLPDWPAAEHLRGRVMFVNDGMRLDGSASIAGIAVPVVRQQIPHFPEPMLSVDAQANSTGMQLLALLRASGLQKEFGDTFNALSIDGPARTRFALVQPLRHGMPGHSLLATVDLDNAKLADARWNLPFTNATGQVRITQDGVSVSAMQVRLDGDPAQLDLGIGASSGDPAIAVNATLTGNLLAANLIARAPSLDWLKPLLVGRSAWSVNVRVPKAAASTTASVPAVLSLRSDLRGTRLSLPAPLDKPTESALPLSVQIPLPTSAGEITARLGGLLSVRGRVDDTQPFRGVLMFGGDAGPSLPSKGIVIAGRAPSIAVGDWVAYAGSSDGVGSALNAIDVQTANLDLLGSAFGSAHVSMIKQANATRVSVEGAQIAGSVQIPTQTGQGIKGDFARLYWPRPPDTSSVVSTTAASISASSQGSANATDTDTANPANVPPLHLEIADLRYGDARLGHATLDTQPSPQGMHIRQLLTHSSAQTLNATGDWTGRGRSARTALAMTFNADSLGDMLDALGFQGVVDDGKARIKLDASWNGGPAAFALARLDGKLELDVGKGRLLEVKPGAGRILGLVSLTAIPRRLGLDFRDFFDKGFSFDTITAHFAFADGKAHTDDLKIKGPAAEIDVRGSADLVAQTYDQVVEVTPRTSGLLTAVGAIAGGPVGAAIGAAAQAVLKKPLGHLTRKRYHVTGPWKDPDVESVPSGNDEHAHDVAHQPE